MLTINIVENAYLSYNNIVELRNPNLFFYTGELYERL